jgi:hypothetical protein
MASQGRRVCPFFLPRTQIACLEWPCVFARPSMATLAWRQSRSRSAEPSRATQVRPWHPAPPERGRLARPALTGCHGWLAHPCSFRRLGRAGDLTNCAAMTRFEQRGESHLGSTEYGLLFSGWRSCGVRNQRRGARTRSRFRPGHAIQQLPDELDFTHRFRRRAQIQNGGPRSTTPRGTWSPWVDVRSRIKRSGCVRSTQPTAYEQGRLEPELQHRRRARANTAARPTRASVIVAGSGTGLGELPTRAP